MSIGIAAAACRCALPAVAALAAPGLAVAQDVLEEVRVVGTPHDRSPAELAQSVSVLTGDTLRRALESNLGETLAGELGVSSSYFGSGASRPVIRGLAGARVRTLEDGVDSLDVSTISSDHAVGIDPSIAEQIEVFRGPSTLLYGSGAVGGVVNTLTGRIPEAAPEDGLAATVDLRAGTVADERAGAVRVDGGGDAWAWHFDAARRDNGDYEVPGSPFAESVLEADHEAPGAEEEVTGYVPNSDFDTSGAAVGVSHIGDLGFFGAALSGFDSDYGVPGHLHASGADEHAGGEEHARDEHADEDGEIVRVALEQRRLDLKGGWFDVGAAVAEIDFRLGIGDYEHVEIESGEIGTRFRNDAWEGRVDLVHAPWGAWEGAFGVQLGSTEYSATGAEAFVPPVDTRHAGLFLLEQRDFGRWQLSAGGRVERVRHAPATAPAVSRTAASVSAAGVMDLGRDRSFVVNAAVAERVPGAEELFSYGPHLASRSFEIGDAGLGIETSRHVDVGLRRTDGRVRWAVTGFHTRFADFVYLASLGTEDEASGLPLFAYRQRDARFSGIEAEVFATLVRIGSGGELDARVYGDLVDAELAGAEHLPRIPPRRLGVRVQYHDDRVLAGLTVVRHDEQDDVAPYETATPGYTLVDADLSWDVGSTGGGELSVMLRASNLLDEVARRHTSLVKDVAPLPGRNYTIGFRASF